MDDDSSSYEIEILSEASDADNEDDNDAEQFELLEVTGTEVNVPKDMSPHKQRIDNADNQDISINTLDVDAGHSSPSDNNKTNSNMDYARRSVRISRKSIKLQQSDSSEMPNDIEKDFKRMCADADELQCSNISTECEVDEPVDHNDYEQLIDNGSGSDEWPAQGTFDDFPTDIIKDGLLQIKGEKMMSLISR